MIKNRFIIILIALTINIACDNDDDDNDISSDPVTVNIDEDTLERAICSDGIANGFSCNNYDLMTHLTLSTLGVGSLNDIWGWTDPDTQKEYALIGTSSNTTFIDISDPENIIIVGTLPTQSVSSPWRDIKVYQNYAFIVSEAVNHGMQVFDLTRLRDTQNIPITYTADTVYTEFSTGSTHNIVINETSGYAYAVGTDDFLGGPHIINIQDPLNPTFAGGFDFIDYTHDAQVVTYNGPDPDYQGREILIGSTENFLTVVDVTDKSNPEFISRVAQDNVGFIHQGWFNESQTLFYTNDELDETEFGFNSRTLVFNLSDLDNPIYEGPYFGPTQAVDHNLYVKENELFLSNYSAGLRIADISDPNPTSITEIGYFDTFPETDDAIFDGVWSVYPFFESGNIIISDISNGFFIIRKTGT